MNEKKVTITPTDTPATSGYLNAREASLLLQEVQTLHDRLDRIEKSLAEVTALLADRVPHDQPTAAGMASVIARVQNMFGKVDERSKSARMQKMFSKVDERS